jgi:hypothetical protein
LINGTVRIQSSPGTAARNGLGSKGLEDTNDSSATYVGKINAPTVPDNTGRMDISPINDLGQFEIKLTERLRQEYAEPYKRLQEELKIKLRELDNLIREYKTKESHWETVKRAAEADPQFKKTMVRFLDASKII